MTTKKLHLTIVSQERELVSTDVVSITAPASEGEVTILPTHIPLLSRLDYGELSYTDVNGEDHSLVISKGFINIDPDNKVTIMVDAAKLIRELSLQKAQQAMEEAKKTMETSTDKQELILAEASLRQAMWELRVAQKTKKSSL